MQLRIRDAPEIVILCVVSDSQVTDDRLAAVAAELGRLGRRLDDLGGELLSLRGTPPDPAPDGGSGAGSGAEREVAPAAPVVPAAVVPPAAVPAAASAPPAAPAPAAPAAQPPSGPRPPAPSRTAPGATTWPGNHPGTAPAAGWQQQYPPAGSGAPWNRQFHAPYAPARPPAAPKKTGAASLTGARLLAWTGGAVTLLGVVMLLVLAASRGWFSPGARLVAGAALGVVLIGLAAWLHRKETARTGAAALAGTGVAALYLVVGSATAQYEYLPPVIGLLLAVLVAAGGLGLADVWRLQALAIGAVVGAAVLAPFVTQGWVPLLGGLVVVLEIAAGIVALRRAWPWLLVVGAGWAVLYTALAAGVARSSALWGAGASAIATLVVGVAFALYALVKRDMTPAHGVLASAALPTLVLAGRLGGWGGAALAAGAAVLMLGVALVPSFSRPVRVVSLAVGAVALLVATSLPFSGEVAIAVIVGEAIGFTVAAAMLRSRITLMFAGGFAILGVLGAVARPIPPTVLALFPMPPFIRGALPQQGALVTGLLVAVLLVGLAVAMLVAFERTGLLGSRDGRTALWVTAGLVGLYGLTGVAVATAVLVSPDRNGFVAGHAVVTVSWTILALVLLARGIRNTPLRIAGLVLVAAAVAKLILFDLVSLDGLARVGAFLGAGLVLLAAGVRYARLVAEAEQADNPLPARPAGPPVPAGAVAPGQAAQGQPPTQAHPPTRAQPPTQAQPPAQGQPPQDQGGRDTWGPPQ